MPKLPDGITGRTRTDGDKGAMNSFSELPINPKRPGSNVSHPGKGTGTGSAPLGEKLTPKHGGGNYA